ncbi:unnamed protein product, partial [Didymodactylos carnosus]
MQLFGNECPGEEVPTRQTVYRLAEKFDETGSVEDAPRSGRPITVRTEENTEVVSEAFRRNPQPSQRRASRDLNVSRTSLQRLMKDLNLMLTDKLHGIGQYLRVNEGLQ